MRGCHGGGGAVAARVPRSRGGRCARVPRRRGGRRAGAPEEGWAPRGCHGGAGRRAGATEGLGAARVPRRGAGRRAGATVSLLIQSPPLGISYPSSTGLRLTSKN